MSDQLLDFNITLVKAGDLVEMVTTIKTPISLNITESKLTIDQAQVLMAMLPRMFPLETGQ